MEVGPFVYDLVHTLFIARHVPIISLTVHLKKFTC